MENSIAFFSVNDRKDPIFTRYLSDLFHQSEDFFNLILMMKSLCVHAKYEPANSVIWLAPAWSLQDCSIDFFSYTYVTYVGCVMHLCVLFGIPYRNHHWIDWFTKPNYCVSKETVYSQICIHMKNDQWITDSDKDVKSTPWEWIQCLCTNWSYSKHITNWRINKFCIKKHSTKSMIQNKISSINQHHPFMLSYGMYAEMYTKPPTKKLHSQS